MTRGVMLTNVAPPSLAKALVSIVLPQPGGPYSKRPFGADIRADGAAEAKSCGYDIGQMLNSVETRLYLPSHQCQRSAH